MNTGKTDIMMILIQNAVENHQKNMRKTFKQMRELEKKEKEVN